MRRNTRLTKQRGYPQKPGKAPFWRRGKPRNAYRRGRQGEPKKFWGRALMAGAGLVGLAGIIMGLMVLYHHFLTSPYFCIKENSNIEIIGLKRLTPELILQQGKLGPTTNLLALKPTQVERDLLAHPWIFRAELTRIWPQRVRLRVKEREPVALVQMGELLYVDRQGRLFKPLSPGDPHDFPVITGLRDEDFHQVEEAMPEVMAKVFQLLEALKGAPPPLHWENISEVHVDHERGFTLYANGLGAAVDVGLTDYGAKLQKFAHIWPVLAQKGYLVKVGRINLDYPQRALLSLKGMEENR